MGMFLLQLSLEVSDILSKFKHTLISKCNNFLIFQSYGIPVIRRTYLGRLFEREEREVEIIQAMENTLFYIIRRSTPG